MTQDGKIPPEELEKLDWVEEVGTQSDAIEGLFAEAKIKGIDPGTIKAGAEIVASILTELLAGLGAINRKISIAINNYPASTLTMPKWYRFSGDIVDATLDIAGDHAGFATAAKKWGAAGTVGVMSYDIEGTDKKLVFLWAIPGNRVSYENWFKISVVANAVPVDKALYKDMYYDYGALTPGKAAKAADASAEWNANGYRLWGNMGTAGETTFNISMQAA